MTEDYPPIAASDTSGIWWCLKCGHRSMIPLNSYEAIEHAVVTHMREAHQSRVFHAITHDSRKITIEDNPSQG